MTSGATSFDVVYSYLPGEKVDDLLLSECAALYSSQYGIYSDQMPDARKRGAQIKLNPQRLRPWFEHQSSRLALARVEGRLIAYATAIKGSVAQLGRISWVTQLVVHEEFRDQGVATTLLSSLWGFSDDFAWGLVTANPFAVRALEAATGRRCDPAEILEFGPQIHSFGCDAVAYFARKQLNSWS